MQVAIDPYTVTNVTGTAFVVAEYLSLIHI